MSLRVLARSSALYTVGNLAPKIGAFILLPIYLRFLTRSDYGVIALLTTLSGLIALVLTFGLDAALMRLHFDLQGRERARLYSTLAIFTLLSSTVLVAVFAVATGPFFPQLFTGIAFFPLGALSLVIALISTIAYVPSVLFRATGRAGYFLLYNLGTFILSSIVSVLLVVVAHLGPAGILLGQLTGAIVVFVVAIGLILSFGAPSFSRSRLFEALRFGLPLVPHGVSAWVLRLSDRSLIGLLIGLPVLQAQAAIGVYSFGYQIGAVIALIAQSFNAAWSPYFFRVGNRPTAPLLYQQVITLVVAGLLVLAVGISALAPEIVNVVATSRYAQAANVIPVVAFASVFQGLYTMFVTAIFFMKRTAQLAAFTVSAALLNVALNFIFIPRIGIMGAAWSTLIAYALWAMATAWYAMRQYPIRIDAARLAPLATVAVAAVFASMAASTSVAQPAQAIIHVVIAAAYAIVAAAVALPALSNLRGLTGTMASEQV
ncbi:MAG: oligosaccharide flippase family protein [Chloroflexota bacterium]